MRTLIGVLLLAMTYCLALASADPWDIGIGLILGFVVLRGFRAFIFPEPSPKGSNLLKSIAYFPRLILAVFIEIVRGTVVVAKAVLSPRPLVEQGFVSIPIGQRTEEGVDFSGFLNTLSPGSVYLGIDDDANSWVIHAMDATDGERSVAEAQEFYEKYQRPVLP